MKGAWKMQRENAVAAVEAVGGGVGALRSAGRMRKHVVEPKKKSSLFHNAVSQVARKSGAVPAHQWPCGSFGGARDRNMSPRKTGSRRFEACIVLLLSNFNDRIAACAI